MLNCPGTWHGTSASFLTRWLMNERLGVMGAFSKHVVGRAAALTFGFFGLITGTALMPRPSHG
jgi:hypothetical protein